MTGRTSTAVTVSGPEPRVCARDCATVSGGTGGTTPSTGRRLCPQSSRGPLFEAGTGVGVGVGSLCVVLGLPGEEELQLPV